MSAGRVQTILLFKIIGVNLMGFMGLYPQIWTKLGVIIPVYVVRTAIINSAYPLQKSILMDYVPKVSNCWSHIWNRPDFTICLAESGTGTSLCLLVDAPLVIEPADMVSPGGNSCLY